MNPIAFFLPFRCGITVNQAYMRINGKTWLKQDARDIRAQILCYIKDNEIKIDHDEEKLHVSLSFEEDWWYKNGNMAKSDIDNRLKFLIDSIFTGLEIDDKFIWKLEAEKLQSETVEGVHVVIGEYDGV